MIEDSRQLTNTGNLPFALRPLLFYLALLLCCWCGLHYFFFPTLAFKMNKIPSLLHMHLPSLPPSLLPSLPSSLPHANAFILPPAPPAPAPAPAPAPPSNCCCCCRAFRLFTSWLKRRAMLTSTVIVWFLRCSRSSLVVFWREGGREGGRGE